MYTYSLNLEFVMLTMMMIAMVVNGDDTDDEDEGVGLCEGSYDLGWSQRACIRDVSPAHL